MSNDKTWLGLRVEDLSIEQREQIANDASTRAAHLQEVELGRLLELPPVVAERPNVNDVFTRSSYATQAFSKLGAEESRRSLVVTLPLLFLVAILWLYTLLGEEWPWESPNNAVVPGGVPVAGGGPVSVKLDATAKAIHGERPLRAGSVIEAPESLQFKVQVTGTGYLVILDVTEGVQQIYPSRDPSSWPVTDGEQAPDRSMRVQRPGADDEKVRKYRAMLCERPPWVVDGAMPEGCMFSDLVLTWR
ncbi:MAG: hypothetical protein VX519_04870 [Myxococcota bacterium]|nr:hypothetical protein [Myxococcota bacterium]